MGRTTAETDRRLAEMGLSRLMSAGELARVLGVSLKTFWSYVQRGLFPPPCWAHGRKLRRWRPEALSAHLARCEAEAEARCAAERQRRERRAELARLEREAADKVELARRGAA